MTTQNPIPDKYRVAWGGAEVIARALYDNLLQQIADCHKLLDAHGVPNIYGSLHGRIDAALRLARMNDVVWYDDDEDYNDTIASFEAGTGRM